MLFRALIQNGLNQLVPGWAAIVIASALFAATHALSWFYVVSAFVLSLFLGTGFAVTGSIALVVFWHFAYNVLSFLVLVRYPNLLMLSPNGEPRRDSEESGDDQGTVT
jgi:membrane protease YdiL (CAAX protease family)